MPFEPTTSVCPRCAVGCTLAYDADEGRATGRPGPANPAGQLCPKGLAAFDDLDAADRLTEPLVREGDDLVPASWDTALDRAAAGLCDVRDDHGPDALAFLGAPHCTNEENYLFGKLARALGTNNVDNRARTCHRSTERALADRFGLGVSTATLASLDDADCVLVSGANPAERQPIAYAAFVRPAVRAGATLVHADPRSTLTTRDADYHLPARPGTDATLFRAMAAVVVEAGLVDRSFVEGRTTGFESFVRDLSALDVCDCAAQVGVEEAALREAARTLGEADGVVALTGTGIESPGHRDTDAADALLDLLLLTGNVGRPGTGVVVLRGLNNEQGANDAGCRPDAFPGYVPVTDAAGREHLDRLWGFEPPPKSGRAEPDLVTAFGGTVHGAYVVGENPAVSRLDDERVARGLASLDCLVVQDARWSETVERADVVLPASAWAEKGGTVTNLDRYVQRVRSAGYPPGDAHTDLEILMDLGRRLADGRFDYDGPADVFDEFTRANPHYAGMTYATLDGGGQRWTVGTDADDDTSKTLYGGGFATPDGRAKFAGDTPTTTPPDSDDDRLVLLTGRRVNEFVGGSGDEGGRSATLELNPADADARGIDDGRSVVVTSGRGWVGVPATVTRRVRPGTAYLPAHVADPLVGQGRTLVRVRPA